MNHLRGDIDRLYPAAVEPMPPGPTLCAALPSVNMFSLDEKDANIVGSSQRLHPEESLKNGKANMRSVLYNMPCYLKKKM